MNEENKVVEEKKEETPIQQPTKKKVDMHSILLILLFILLFGVVFGMPYINDFIKNLRSSAGLDPIEQRAKQIENNQKAQEKQKKKEETPVEQEELQTLTCISPITNATDYDVITTEIFNYNSKNEVLESSKIITYTFAAKNNSYDILINDCNEKTEKYLEKAEKGYELACSSSETEIAITDKFDLEIFKSFKNGDSIIEANAKYKAKINTVKKNLEAKGYSCK